MNCTRSYSYLILVSTVVLLSFSTFYPTDNFAQPTINAYQIEQLHLYNITNPILYSTVGMFTLFYTPVVTGWYLNVVALDIFEQPYWIVRNLYIPDKSWLDRQQSISTRFCFGSLGFSPGQAVALLSIAVSLDETVRAVMPVPGEYVPIPVDTLREDVEGDETPVLPTTPTVLPVGSCPQYPAYSSEDIITPVDYRGCRVPNIDLDDSTYPDNQEYAGDRNACGPASAANSLEWLDSISTKIDLPQPVRTTMEELSGMMNRARNGGVTIDNFVRGKLDFIESHNLPIDVKFQSHFLPEDVVSTSGETLARNDSAGPYPTWEWLKQQVADSEDVEIMYYWWDGESWRGHAVVITGLEESQDGSLKSIKFKHDVRQAGEGGTRQENESIKIDEHGRMILMSRNAFIGNAVAESPGDPFPTPVELGIFNAEVLKRTVLLQWNTESESNNYGFKILRDDEEIGFVPGNGTTAEPQSYSYLDANLSNGTYHYQLVQIDFDGTAENIGGLTVTVMNNPGKFALSQNFPNPFNAATKITYTVPEKGLVTIRIYNMIGEQIETLVHQQKDAGIHSIDFDASHLANGIYFYRMEAPGFSQVRKFLLLK